MFLNKKFLSSRIILKLNYVPFLAASTKKGLLENYKQIPASEADVYLMDWG